MTGSGQPHEKHQHVFAVVRYDGADQDSVQDFTITKVLVSSEAAQAEVERLNALHAGTNQRYSWQQTRLIESP